MRRYREFRSDLCRRLAAAGPGTAGALAHVGLPEQADREAICADDPPEALASGAFLQARADEVLLSVTSGVNKADGGGATLALMRADGSGYRFVQHMLLAQAFDAPLRISRRDGKDVLVLCETGGGQGLYPKECGFLGFGTFREEPSDDGLRDPTFAQRNEFELGDMITCGPATTVDLGKSTLSGDQLIISLVVTTSVRTARSRQETEANECSNEVHRTQRAYPVTYRIFEDDHEHQATGPVARVSPIPKAVMAALEVY